VTLVLADKVFPDERMRKKIAADRAPARYGRRFSSAGGVWQNEPNFDATSISTMVAGSDDPATLALARIPSEAEIELSQVRTSERQG
jgi:hypothetical protein